MAQKKGVGLIRLISTAGTGYFVVRKGSRKKTLSFRKHDPIARKHVLFKEAKMK